ncbi:MAG: VWA domain-containing protein [Proteobacteria bacterium]|jgi:nitric oxide reductase NorD protein|nr:VWA domain-containing protein [Pseudomonadota bacterium]
MAQALSDFLSPDDDCSESLRLALEEQWANLPRVFSSRGIDNYLKGCTALDQLGRSEELPLAFAACMPEVARAIGEDVLPDIVNFLLSMASKTSGQVLAAIVHAAPIVARRLGDPELFRQFLQVLANMLAQVPRGVRPMLEQLDTLLSQLTLGGLRRWALWGAQAYKNDLEGQVLYFSLQSEDARAMLQAERKGTLFVDVQRRLLIYLRAIWGRDFFLRPTSGDYEHREGLKPYIDRFVIHIPDAFDDWSDAGEKKTVSGLDVYRAVVNHCAAHLQFGREPLTDEGLTPLQRHLVECIEDARVEYLAGQAFPNMRDSWAVFHAEPLGESSPLRIADLLRRLALRLTNPKGRDSHEWVEYAAHCFFSHPDLTQGLASVSIALAIDAKLGQLELPSFDSRLDSFTLFYRDDNRVIWQPDSQDEQDALALTWQQKQVRKKVSIMEMVNEVNNEFAGDDAQEIWVLPTEFFLDQEGVSINSLEGREPVSSPFYYDEWDYQIQLDRPAWVTLYERAAPRGDAAVIDALLAEHKPVVSRLKYLIESMVPQGLKRIRRQEEGDEIDLNAAVSSFIDLRMGYQPDPRIMTRYKRSERDVCVLVLLDLSESSNDTVRGQDFTVIELTRAATVLMADALSRVGDAFAIHGFCSNGRDDVHYYRMKNFDEPYEKEAKARLAGLSGSYSTRMGAAIRHASSLLAQRSERKKLIFVVTDGEPADNDVRDPQYLRADTKKAVEQAGRLGVNCYALSLDPYADQYVSSIFGAGRFTVLDHVERLPEKLPMLYLGLTH